MKRLVLILLTLVLLQGCSLSEKRDYTERVLQYESYYQSILDNDKFKKESPFFNVDAKIEKKGETYVYEIIVDEAKVAMYDVKIMVVENKKGYNSEEKMMPSAGILEKNPYNMIPNQSRQNKNYVNGFQLLGEVDKDAVNIQMLVVFNDYRKLNVHREFLEFDLKYEDPKSKEKQDEKKEDKKEESKKEE